MVYIEQYKEKEQLPLLDRPVLPKVWSLRSNVTSLRRALRESLPVDQINLAAAKFGHRKAIWLSLAF